MDQEKTPKSEYQTPKLERYGTLSELTKAGASSGGEDFIFAQTGMPGSVNPPIPGPPPGRP